MFFEAALLANDFTALAISTEIISGWITDYISSSSLCWFFVVSLHLYISNNNNNKFTELTFVVSQPPIWSRSIHTIFDVFYMHESILFAADMHTVSI